MIAITSSLISSINFAVVIWCNFKIYYFLKSQNCTVINGRRYSEVQSQIAKTIAAQALIPLVLIFLPFMFLIVCIYGPFEISPRLSAIPTLLFGYLPIINSLSILSFVKAYKHQMASFLKTKLGKLRTNKISRICSI